MMKEKFLVGRHNRNYNNCIIPTHPCKSDRSPLWTGRVWSKWELFIISPNKFGFHWNRIGEWKLSAESWWQKDALTLALGGLWFLLCSWLWRWALVLALLWLLRWALVLALLWRWLWFWLRSDSDSGLLCDCSKRSPNVREQCFAQYGDVGLWLESWALVWYTFVLAPSI